MTKRSWIQVLPDAGLFYVYLSFAISPQFISPFDDGQHYGHNFVPKSASQRPLIILEDVLSLAWKTSSDQHQRCSLIGLEDVPSLASKISSDHPQRRSLISLEDILSLASKMSSDRPRTRPLTVLKMVPSLASKIISHWPRINLS